mgnify:CR=1 FL=1|jgi:hypothetical protein
MNNWKYVVDSSAIIRRSKYQCYDIDAFKNHWRNFDEMIKDGTIISTPQVQMEIRAKNFEALQWATDNELMFQLLRGPVINELNNLSSIFKEWYTIGHERKDVWADPEIIAFAKAYDLVIVTMEGWNVNSEEQNHSIPTICEKLDGYVHIGDKYTTDVDKDTPFQCIDLLEFFKREEMYL